MPWFSDIVFNFHKTPYFKHDITEIQWIFRHFFQNSNLTFVASEFKILFLLCIELIFTVPIRRKIVLMKRSYQG